MSTELSHPLPRGEGCPSELTLDQLEVGELTGPERQEAEAHLSGCAGCQARLEQRRGVAQAFDMDAMVNRLHARSAGLEMPEVLRAALRPSEAIAQPPARAGVFDFFRRIWPALAGAAAVLVVALVLLPPSEAPVDSLRSKGGAGLRVFVDRGQGGVEVHSGEALHPRERVMLRATIPASGHAMVVGRDPGGTVYAAFPLGGAGSVEVAAGERDLPALELDGALGEEWLHLVACPRPFQLAELRVGERGTELPAATCVSAGFKMVKVAR